MRCLLALPPTVYVLAMVGHLKNVSPAFVQMPNKITNVEFTIVDPTIANTMLAVRSFIPLVVYIQIVPVQLLWCFLIFRIVVRHLPLSAAYQCIVQLLHLYRLNFASI